MNLRLSSGVTHVAGHRHRPASRLPSVEPDLTARARADGIEFLLAVFVDLTGKPCAKLVPIEAVDELTRDGVGFAGYAAGALGQQPSDPDVVARPDVSSYTPLPFVQPGLALVHCDPYVDGTPWPYAPRVILKSMLRRAAEQGLELFVGAEVEYFLVHRDAGGALGVADARETAQRPCYDARDLTRIYDHLTAVSRAMNQLGWGNYANDHEDGNGQFEQNFHYADALTTADRVTTLRYLISVLAEQRGMTATFMPKLTVSQQQVFHFRQRDPDEQWPVFVHKHDLQTFGLPSGRDGGSAPAIKLGQHDGGTPTTALERSGVVDPAARVRMVEHVERWLPGLDPAPVGEVTCLYTSTPNEDFVLDRVGPVVVASPCSGHGAKFAPLIGVLAADLALGVGQPHPRFALPVAV
jgi:hypothetical protein